ncbi:hypothetical protein [Streptomyces catenulae]|uniref:Uncharacterized protein n=1 Tax=Streptomyces catenulae TaxID=66875 RepID=A0ABV2YZ09_9ACTN|nr:hypothetical protein [Streptomyces catenulae]
MKKIRAAVIAATIIAGTALAATPAQALSHCNRGTGTIICEYGVATFTSKAGVQREFAIGTDHAAYVRSKTATTDWSDWSSLGGEWWGNVVLLDGDHKNIEFYVSLVGTDGRSWVNGYAWDGTRTGWKLFGQHT